MIAVRNQVSILLSGWTQNGKESPEIGQSITIAFTAATYGIHFLYFFGFQHTKISYSIGFVSFLFCMIAPFGKLIFSLKEKKDLAFMTFVLVAFMVFSWSMIYLFRLMIETQITYIKEL